MGLLLFTLLLLLAGSPQCLGRLVINTWGFQEAAQSGKNTFENHISVNPISIRFLAWNALKSGSDGIDAIVAGCSSKDLLKYTPIRVPAITLDNLQSANNCNAMEQWGTEAVPMRMGRLIWMP